MADDREPSSAQPYPSSLCHRCAHSRRVESRRGSVFLMCRALPQKYLPQPVLRCGAFSAREGD